MLSSQSFAYLQIHLYLWKLTAPHPLLQSSLPPLARLLTLRSVCVLKAYEVYTKQELYTMACVLFQNVPIQSMLKA